MCEFRCRRVSQRKLVEREVLTGNFRPSGLRQRSYWVRSGRSPFTTLHFRPLPLFPTCTITPRPQFRARSSCDDSSAPKSRGKDGE